MARPRRYLIPLLAIIFVYSCYLIITSHVNMWSYFMKIAISSETMMFVGQRLNFVKTQQMTHVAESKWRQLSMYDVFDKHKARTSERCNNSCDVKLDMGCAATTLDAWQKVMLSPEFKFMPLLSDFEYIYPFEADYLSHPPMTDSQVLPSLNLSKVYIEGTGSGEILCSVGDTLRGRVDLVDGYGKQRTMGGDEVRVWMVDNKTKKYKAAGHATDMKNGSYQLSVRCLWPGKSQLHVAVAYPREYLRVVIHQIHLGVTWFIAAMFKKQKEEEVSICIATPNIPGRSCLCNMTSLNQQSLYCGRPVNPKLTCEDWTGTYSLPIPPPHNVTQAEYQLIKDIPKQMSKKVIPHNITIFVNSQGQLPTVKSCAETSPAKTWEIDRTQGNWSPGDNWQSLMCERPKMTAEWTMSCLRNSSVWVFGDSNGIRFSQSILSLTKVENNPRTWPYQFEKRDKLNGITFTFTPSEYPLYLGQVWRPRLPYGGVAKQIDEIPSNGTHFLVIHYFFHIMTSHLSIAYLRLKAVRDANQRLINRNPNVVVGKRGPHVSSVEFDYNHAIGGDNLGVYFLEMIQHIFADLKHKVIFLDGWEMTIGLENSGFHPNNTVPYELARTLLAFKCS